MSNLEVVLVIKIEVSVSVWEVFQHYTTTVCGNGSNGLGKKCCGALFL